MAIGHRHEDHGYLESSYDPDPPCLSFVQKKPEQKKRQQRRNNGYGAYAIPEYPFRQGYVFCPGGQKYQRSRNKGANIHISCFGYEISLSFFGIRFADQINGGKESANEYGKKSDGQREPIQPVPYKGAHKTI